MVDEYIAELEREIADWKEIETVMRQDWFAGRLLHIGKSYRCGLCPKYAVGVERPCRQCPIVFVTRRSCIWNWRKGGVVIGQEYESQEKAIEYVAGTVKFMEAIAEKLRESLEKKSEVV